MHFSTLAVASGMASVAAAEYALAEDFFNGNFFDHFSFYTGTDPTEGFVDYVDRSTAQSGGLINTDNGAYIGVDHTTTGVAAPGRQSVRLSSNNAYTYMLVVLDLYNMPGGIPGTWPAFWSFGPDWPNNGEIDIIEGVNDQTVNYMTIHVGTSCTITAAGDGLLQPYSTDCNANDNSNEGCSYHDDSTTSYGTGFNSAGGGIYAMEWTTGGVSIWRWARGNAPSDIKSDNPAPANWGPPSANWNVSTSECDWVASLSQHNLIFDTTFCGSWGGAVYPGGNSACETYVANNPSAFTNAYWGVNSLKVYQKTSESTESGASNTPESSASSAVSMSSAVPAAAQSPSTLSSSTITSAATTTSAAITTTTTTSVSSASTTTSSSAWGGYHNPPAAEETSQPLTGDDFGAGSPGIPASQMGWKRAADMRMGERRAKRAHLRRHAQQASA